MHRQTALRSQSRTWDPQPSVETQPALAIRTFSQSIAVKFNIYNYQNEGSDSTGVYTDGQPPVLPSVDISPSGIQLSSGDSIQAKITYDGTTLTLNLLDLINQRHLYDVASQSTSLNLSVVTRPTSASRGVPGGLISNSGHSQLDLHYSIGTACFRTPGRHL